MTNEDFSAIVSQYERFVFTICYQLVRDYQEAQNLAQEAFLSAYGHIDGCNPKDYKPWLARIAANKAKDYLKSAYFRRVSLETEDGELAELPIEAAPDEIYIIKESTEQIRRQILSLREPYLRVCTLYFLEEKNTKEIAKILARPEKTVQTQLYRAKLILQKQLKEERQT